MSLLWRHRPAPPPAGVVLVLHGGEEHGTRPPSRLNPPLQRMRPFERALRRSPLGDTLGVAEVGYRCRGWNGERADAAVDAEDALAELVREVGPGMPVVLLGHSMGGRAALRIGGHTSVAGVVALAPWCPNNEPVMQLADRRVLIVHSDEDRVTPPGESLDLAARARTVGAQVARCVISGSDHAMVRRAPTWHRLTTLLTGALLGAWAFPEPVTKALARTGREADGLDLRLPLWAPAGR
ncbi:alpha/beta hydrolase [Streptacidiphilus jiangxiensis]|uniref:Predicted esterase n=1 Tax=Streptacidiphilus jiangxiensis TaxID=235985 RepID=A0A1H7WU83_STRJI|nr:alpha/beta hydrolase [Streptacidiphilus jiangxiensis]SEM24971.1 Predicted esterase [Streptacidiphilus jiangxiensis]